MVVLEADRRRGSGSGLVFAPDGRPLSSQCCVSQRKHRVGKGTEWLCVQVSSLRSPLWNVPNSVAHRPSMAGGEVGGLIMQLVKLENQTCHFISL